MKALKHCNNKCYFYTVTKYYFSSRHCPEHKASCNYLGLGSLNFAERYLEIHLIYFLVQYEAINLAERYGKNKILLHLHSYSTFLQQINTNLINTITDIF